MLSCVRAGAVESELEKELGALRKEEAILKVPSLSLALSRARSLSRSLSTSLALPLLALIPRNPLETALPHSPRSRAHTNTHTQTQTDTDTLAQATAPKSERLLQVWKEIRALTDDLQDERERLQGKWLRGVSKVRCLARASILYRRVYVYVYDCRPISKAR